MNRAIEWFTHNTVAANLLMVLIILGGWFTIGAVKQEVFPEIDSDMITVSVLYLGASPEEVEEGVCIKIEEQIQGLDGIKEISSNSSEGSGTVTVEVRTDADTRQLLDEIKARVDAIDTFPDETERPVIQEVLIRRQVIDVAISGNTDETTLKRIGERVRDEIAAIPGISQVDLVNARPYEISIEVSEEALQRHGLSFDEVAMAVRRSSLDLPGGSVKTPGGEILVRTLGQAYKGEEFENLILISKRDGTRLRLGDVARVVDGFAETDQSARFNGNPTVSVQVFRVGEESALDVSDKVKNYIAEARTRLPGGIELTTWQDDARVLRSRLDLLLRNGRTGLILVIILLALFLKLRYAFWVMLGIPISFLGAIWLMPTMGVSFNLISLFAFIVVLGIVVDDAIVVGENINTQQNLGKSGVAGAVAGAQEIAVPVIFAVLTSVAAFAPLLFVEGGMGQFMRVIPMIVIAVLLFSLVESLLILPAHLSHIKSLPTKENASKGLGPWGKVQQGVVSLMRRFIKAFYLPSLRFALRWRYLAAAWGVATLILTMGYVKAGYIKFIFMPDVEADYVGAMLTMPLGTPERVTAEAVQRLEATALELKREFNGESVEADGASDGGAIRHISAAVGDQPFRTRQAGHMSGNVSFSAAHLGEVTLELAPAEERDVSSSEIANRWRELTGPVADAVELTFTSSLFNTGEAVNVQFSGNDVDELRSAGETLKAKLREYPGVTEISDSFREGKQEIKLSIKPGAEALGLTLSDLARQVRQGFYGEEAQRIQRGRDDVRVMVRYPAEGRRSLGNLENMRIRVPGGGEVPFRQVATADLGRGFADIRRVDRRRTLNVTADVDTSQVTPDEVIGALTSDVLPGILAEHPGVFYTLEGEQRERMESMSSLKGGFAMALIVIYTLLAVPFRSYVQPLIVMLAIPFGLVGAVFGHVIMGLDLTMLSMFGLVALTGVVVNDSLVLIDLVNRKRAEGLSVSDALLEGGAGRFRPILLTSLTTFAGLTPLLLEKSLQAQFLIPMAASLAFGVIAATFLTLILIPAGYYIMEDIRGFFWRIFGRTPKTTSELGAPMS